MDDYYTAFELNERRARLLDHYGDDDEDEDRWKIYSSSFRLSLSLEKIRHQQHLPTRVTSFAPKPFSQSQAISTSKQASSSPIFKLDCR